MVLRPSQLLARLSFIVLLLLSVTALAAEPIYGWRVQSETARITLVGSIHVGTPDMYPIPLPLRQDFKVADVLAVEVDMTDPEVIQKSTMLLLQQGMLADGETLKDHLSEETWQRLETHLKTLGLPMSLFEKYRPGILTMMLVMREYQALGFDPNLGIDKHFLDQAQAADKEIRSLETIEAQMELFLSLDEKLDDIMVAETLDQMGQMADMFKEMVKLWKAGDAQGLSRFMALQTGDDPEMLAFYDRLLNDRNVVMADKINTWLDQDQDIFVVVGAGHFGGDMGIENLLAGKGRTVQQMEH